MRRGAEPATNLMRRRLLPQKGSAFCGALQPHHSQNPMKITAAIAIAFLLAGCANNPNLVGARGNEVNKSYSLQDRRAAKLHIKISPVLPSSARSMGTITAERCHQYAQDEKPTDATLTDDLVLRAYSDGADGITNLRFERESALLKNCWHLVRGHATIYQNR